MNLPLGVQAGTEYSECTQKLMAGDRILFYTDGITEATSPDGQMFGVERMDGVITDCSADAKRLLGMDSEHAQKLDLGVRQFDEDGLHAVLGLVLDSRDRGPQHVAIAAGRGLEVGHGYRHMVETSDHGFCPQPSSSAASAAAVRRVIWTSTIGRR